jgi:hypothetical protein
MKQIRTAGLILVAMLAIGALAAATASAALPELVNSKGEALVKKKYTSKSGASTLETEKNGAVKCKEGTDTGESTGPKTGTSTVTFTGCESASIKCKTSGAKTGEIITKATSKLVYINEKEKTVGLALAATESTIECSILQKLKVRGSVIGVLTPVNTVAEEFTLTFKQKKGVQEPTEYEEEGKKVKDITETEGSGIKTFKFEPSGLETTDTLKFEEKVEVKA